MHHLVFAISLVVLPILSFSLPSALSSQQPLQLSPSKPSTQSNFKHIHHALKKADIIPSILPDFKPVCHIRISYAPNSKKDEVSLGNKLKHSKTEKKPVVWILCGNSDEVDLSSSAGENYTIALTDPDAPSRKDPKWSEMCHWIATEKGDVVSYKAPAPPKHTSYHRYIFVLLSGNNANLTAPSDRQHWGTGKERHGVADWASSQNLTVVGADWFIEKHE